MAFVQKHQAYGKHVSAALTTNFANLQIDGDDEAPQGHGLSLSPAPAPVSPAPATPQGSPAAVTPPVRASSLVISRSGHRSSCYGSHETPKEGAIFSTIYCFILRAIGSIDDNLLVPQLVCTASDANANANGTQEVGHFRIAAKTAKQQVVKFEQPKRKSEIVEKR